MAVRLTLSEKVYVELKNGILEGKYQQGSELTEVLLAEEYKVSRTPIREALKKLEQESLVRIIPHKGALVIKPSLKDMIEINDIREALEGLAARLAAKWAPEDEVKELIDRFPVRINSKLLEEDRLKAYRVGVEMHEMIRKYTRNKRLSTMIKNIENQIDLIMQLNADIPGRHDMAYDEHLRILNSILNRSPEEAEAEMRNHIKRVSESLIDYMQSGY